MTPEPSLHQRIYAVVAEIPKGCVATYGQVAELAGLAGHARLVGYALNAFPEDLQIPWHRVINANGRISPRSDPEWEGFQRALLEAEGVAFDEQGKISLRRFGWRAAPDFSSGFEAKQFRSGRGMRSSG